MSHGLKGIFCFICVAAGCNGDGRAVMAGARTATTGRGQRPRYADGLSGFELGDKALGHFHAVADDGILCGVEDGGIGVFVDGDDGLGTADTC